MADFSFVTHRLATGAAVSTPDDVDELAAAGVTHVIDCRAELDDAPLLASHPELTYLWDGTEDDGQPKPLHWWSRGIVFALDGLSHRHHRVYAHCAAGVNRGPSMCFAILLALGLEPVVAEGLVRTARPQVGLAYKQDAIEKLPRLGYG